MTNPEAEPISAEGLAELRRLYDAATPGRWLFCGVETAIYTDEHAEDILEGDDEMAATNRRLMVALHNAFPALLAEIATLRAREAEFVRFEVKDMRNG